MFGEGCLGVFFGVFGLIVFFDDFVIFFLVFIFYVEFDYLSFIGLGIVVVEVYDVDVFLICIEIVFFVEGVVF